MNLILEILLGIWLASPVVLSLVIWCLKDMLKRQEQYAKEWHERAMFYMDLLNKK